MPPHDNPQFPATRTVVLQDESLRQFEGGFTAIPNRVLRNADLSLGARMAYAMLLKYAWQDDFCWPAQAQIAKDLGLKERMTRYYLEELRKAKLISWKQQGLNRPNIYYILKLPDLPPPQETTPRRSAAIPDRQYIATPDRQRIAAQDRQYTSGQDRQQIADYKDPKNKTQLHVNVKAPKKRKDTRTDLRLTSDTQPINELMETRYSRLTAEASQQHTTIRSADDRMNGEAKEDYYVTEIMDQLGDTDPRSRPTYRKILRTLGTSLTLRLVGSTRDAYADGVIKQQKMAPYFMGMVKRTAAEQGIDLPFRTRQS